MTQDEMDKMEKINTKLTLGDKITPDEKEFYNTHFDEMIEEVTSVYENWVFHSHKIK